MPHSGRRGYTLLELAVVLGGVLLLTLMCLPVYHKAREHARQASCQSNLKQLAQACLMYSEDYDDHIPAGQRGVACTSYTWRVMLYPYVKRAETFHCPSQSLPRRSRWQGPVHPFHEFERRSGYGCNRLHGSWPTADPVGPFTGNAVWRRPAHAGEVVVVDPARTVLLAESNGPWSIVGEPANEHFGPGLLKAPALAAQRHNRQANYAYADGHVHGDRPTELQCGSGGGEDNCPWSIE